MGGNTKVYDTAPSDIRPLRSQMTNYLLGNPGQQGARVQKSPVNLVRDLMANPGGAAGARRQLGPNGLPAGGPQPAGGGGGYAGVGGPNVGPNGTGGFGDREYSNGGYPAPGERYGPIGEPAPHPFDRMKTPDAGPIDRTVLGPAAQVAGPNRNDIRNVQAGQVEFDPTTVGMLNPNALPQVGGAYGELGTNRGALQGNRQQVGTQFSVPGQTTQSVDQLGGANSAFYRNMVGQLQPSFDQARAEALAAAKESAGTLTGSGYGNALGGAVNRSLGAQQAALAEYATRGIESEVGRQTALAGINNQGNIAGMQAGLEGQIANQRAGSTADADWMNYLVNRGQIGQQGEVANQDTAARLGIANQGTQTDLARLGLQARQGNQDADLRAGVANQGADTAYQGNLLNANTTNANATNAMTQQQGNMDQQRIITEYQTRAAAGDANAQRFLQMLLGMGTTGVGPSEVVRTPGIGEQLIGGAVQVGSAYAGGRR